MDLNIEDFTALRSYLDRSGHAGANDAISFRALPGGVSNRTVKVTWADGRAWVLKQALSKLRVQADWFSSPERIGVEARALRWLNQSAPPGTTPAFIFEDPVNHVMAMDAVPEEHYNWKSLLLEGQIVPYHFEQFGLVLGAIHRRSSKSRAEVSRLFADTTYFENLRLEPYYLHAAKMTPSAASFLGNLAQETLRNRESLVHGDFSPKNVLVYNNRLILLDYEVVHFGDPAFDLGFALTHFLAKANHLPEARPHLRDAAALFWQTYRTEVAACAWANSFEPRIVRHAIGCLLARVAGKSPLEYLTPRELARQRSIVLRFIAGPPKTVSQLIAEFIAGIEDYAED